MLKRFLILLVSIFLLSQSAFSQKADAPKSDDIKTQSKQLSEVKDAIRKKQLEKDRLALQEKLFKRELKTLNDAIEQNEANLNKLAADIKAAEKNLDDASSSYNMAFAKSSDWNRKMLDDMELFNKASFAHSYEQNPVEYKIRRAALERAKEKFDKEKKLAEVSAGNVKKWEKAKINLLYLRKKETALALERKGLIDEKNALLKNASGQKARAEKEIKELNENAAALQALIKKLTQAQAQKQKQQKQKELRPAATSIKRKKNLPWPVEGKVALKFGKNKHPELDADIISNGIKIKAPDGSFVKSVDSGIVVFAGDFRSYGKVVIIDHKDFFAVYGQLSRILVAEEQKVLKGGHIAALGSGENAVLYFEIRQNNIPDNPLLWLEDK